jgi:signal transduction histidine kinase
MNRNIMSFNPLEDPDFFVNVLQNLNVGMSILRLDDPNDTNSLRLIANNPKAEELTRLPHEQLLNRRLVDVFPYLAHSGALEIYADVVRTQTRHILPEVVATTTDYISSRVYKAEAFPLLNQCLGITFEDITDIKRSQNEIQQVANRLRVLSEVSKELVAYTTDFQELLKVIVRRSATILQNACLVRLLSDDGEVLKTAALHATEPDKQGLLEQIVNLASPKGDRELTGEVMRSGRPLLLANMSSDVLKNTMTPEGRAYLEATGIHSLMLVPMRIQQRTIGILYLMRHDPALPPYTEDDLHLAEDLAERAALAIENARLVNELEKRVVERTRDLTRLNHELEIALRDEMEVGELKTRFISMVSHEFRTPLSIIQLAAETIRKYRDRLSQDVQNQKLDVIRRQVQHLSALLESILFVNRAEQVGIHANKTSFNLDDLCQEVLQSLTALHENRQGITLREFGDCQAVYSDRVLLQQILLNLVSNAIKYSPPTAPIQINIFCEDDLLTLQIRDQGIGIPKEDLQNLFQMFYRASNVEKTKGIGVGLVVVKQAVDALDGSIMVESEVNKGTSFTIVIPTAA